ncbi:hypothetical protein IPA_03480 [Ignicoccus pacificus DSM 13166]|uniref:DUF2208 domain-containing protein n=1 Tax=Ignicoccus pacificus DSM 13166 TaxID=940294 RepID=A0A977PLG6_9CREN|nr:hypothetical protein IPA_03480 [Ignicoccus pacificus DSM 13166]
MQVQTMGKKSLILSQVSMTIFALVMSFFPNYYGLLLLAYFLIMPVIMYKFMAKPLKEAMGRVKGKTLHEENAKELFEKDPEFEWIMKGQMFQSLLSSLPLLVLIAFGFTLWPVITHISDPWIRFAAIIAYFEGYTVLNYLVNKHMAKQVMKVPKPITNYKITDKGIQIKPFGTINFPLQSYVVKLKKESYAVDLLSKKEGSPSYRIYTKNPEKVYQLLSSLGLKVEEAESSVA